MNGNHRRNNHESHAIAEILSPVITQHIVERRRGADRRLRPALTHALSEAGYRAATHKILGPISLGRDPKTGQLRPEQAWAIADIGVWRADSLVGVVEVEHNLAWVVPNGRGTPGSSAAAGYTMSSVARNCDGNHFESYSSLERMAYIAGWQGNAAATRSVLEGLRSDECNAHNPSRLALFLVTEIDDPKVKILDRRLRSLGVTYLSAA